MADLCALCENPMNPGQNRADTADGKAHSSCAAIADPNTGFFDAIEFIRGMEDAARDAGQKEIRALLTDPKVVEGIATAAREAIPSKATRLRRLMDHAADALDKRVKATTSNYEANRLDTAAMVEAMTVLRTVAIYVMDDE